MTRQWDFATPGSPDVIFWGASVTELFVPPDMLAMHLLPQLCYSF
jgi:hypothetical protein